MPSSLFLSTSLMLLVLMMVPSVVLGDSSDSSDSGWCVFGVNEFTTPPVLFSEIAQFSAHQYACRIDCETIEELPEDGTYSCEWHSGIFGGAHQFECVYKKRAGANNKFELYGECPGQSGRGYTMDEEQLPEEWKPER